MSTVARTRIIRIGNSQGIRIPKIVIDQLGWSEDVELAIEHNQLVVRPPRRPRQGWDEAFKSMAGRCDDRLLDAEASNLSQWDQDEWNW